jgi:hypothetical protein
LAYLKCDHKICLNVGVLKKMFREIILALKDTISLYYY